MNPSYISTNQEELFDKASPEIQQLILGGEVNNITASLGKIYKLPVGSYVALSNIISFILIGALLPKDVVTAIQDILKISSGDAYKLAEDLEKSILHKARINITQEPKEEMVTLTFSEKGSTEELRKEILDTTSRESGLVKDQSTISPKQASGKVTTSLTPGSRSQLLEQLKVLDSIPDDEEVNERLDRIKEQLGSLDKSRDEGLKSKVPLEEFMFGEKGSVAIEPEVGPATYSRAPTKYNIDPYREVVSE